MIAYLLLPIAAIILVAFVPYAVAQNDDEISAYNSCNDIKHIIQNESGDKYRSDLFQYNLFGCENMTGVYLRNDPIFNGLMDLLYHNDTCNINLGCQCICIN